MSSTHYTFTQSPSEPEPGQLSFTQTPSTGDGGAAALAAANQTIASLNARITSITAADSIQINSQQAQITSLQAALAAEQSSHGSTPIAAVWAHSIPAAYGATFGSHYPLDYVPGGPAVTDALMTARFTALKLSGVDGVSVDRFTDPSFFVQIIRCADAAGIAVAPCIDFSLVSPNTNSAKQAAATAYVQGWISAAAGHTSPALIGGAYVVFTFGHSALPAANWAAFRTALSPATICLIGDCGTGTSVSAASFTNAVNANIASCDRLYWFGYPFNSTDYGRMIAAFAASGKPFYLPAFPGYAREGQLQTDALGDLTYEGSYQAAAEVMAQYPAQAIGLHITTADDTTEQTDIVRTSTKSAAMLSLTSWYAALAKRQPLPTGLPKLSLSSPMCLYAGQSSQATVRAFNPSASAQFLRVSAYDPFGGGLGQASVLIPPLSTQVMTVPLKLSGVDTAAHVTAFGAGATSRLDSYGHAWLFLTATLTDDLSGSPVATLTSAPVSLYAAAYTGSVTRTLYYSVCSGLRGNDSALTATCYVHKNGSNYYIDAAAPSGVTAKYIEVLKDNRQVYLAYNLQTLSYMRFNMPPSNPLDAYPNDTSDHDDWMVRLIDTSDRVYYSSKLHLLTP